MTTRCYGTCVKTAESTISYVDSVPTTTTRPMRTNRFVAFGDGAYTSIEHVDRFQVNENRVLFLGRSYENIILP